MILFRGLFIQYVYKYHMIFSIGNGDFLYKFLKILLISVFIIPFAILSFIGLIVDMIFLIPSHWTIIGYVFFILSKIVNLPSWILYRIIMIPDEIYKTDVYNIYSEGLSLVEEDDIIMQ